MRFGAIAALVLLAGPIAAEAVLFSPTERQIQEAIELGERSITRDNVGLEWRVRNAAGDALTVMTPYHRLALTARHAAFRHEPLKPRDRSRVLKEQQDRLVFLVELKGLRDDFARFYTPRLLVGAREIEPTFTQNERTAARGEDGKFVAQCVYGFPTKLLSATGKVVLVIRDGDSRNLTSFTIDLSTMR